MNAVEMVSNFLINVFFEQTRPTLVCSLKCRMGTDQLNVCVYPGEKTLSQRMVWDEVLYLI